MLWEHLKLPLFGPTVLRPYILNLNPRAKKLRNHDCHGLALIIGFRGSGFRIGFGGFWQPKQFSTNTSQGISYMGGCQNYGPFLGTLDIRCRILIGIQKRGP